jgi:hypothetical protein
MPAIIETTMGQLILDFENIQFTLDTGQLVEYETIKRVCQEYWAELKARTERERARRGYQT